MRFIDRSGKPPLALRKPGAQVTQFASGATRSSDGGKLDYEGYLSPLVVKRFGEFMLKHQTQEDGKERTSDNWKKGIPKTAYLKSLLRHVVDVWLHVSGWGYKATESLEDSLCATMFNSMGLLHELLKERERERD